MNLVVGVGLPAERMPPAAGAIRMRTALPADRPFAMSLVPRLVASSPARWRNPRKACRAYGSAIEAILEAAGSQSALLVGECGREPLGVVLLCAASNCYTHERQGHLAQAAVACAWQATVEAIALIEVAGAWARSRGYVVLTPDGFRAGHPAMALCRLITPRAEGRNPETNNPNGIRS